MGNTEELFPNGLAPKKIQTGDLKVYAGKFLIEGVKCNLADTSKG